MTFDEVAQVDAVIIRQGELVGREVMVYETTEAIGTVEHLLVDVKQSHVVGLVCKPSGLLGRKQSLSWSQLVNIGRDCLVIHSEMSAEFAASEDRLAAAQNMTGLEVWTDGGDQIGQVVDLCLDLETGLVQQYLFALSQGDRLADTDLDDDFEDTFESDAPAAATMSVYAIAPQAIISAGRKRMMVAEEDARSAQPYEQPLPKAKAADSSTAADWRPDSLEMPADLGDLLQKGQSFAGKMTERVRQQAKRFNDDRLAHQDRADADAIPEITEQLQAKTDQVRQQMQQRLTKAKDQLDHQLEDRLGKTPLGRSLSERLSKLGRSQETPADSIDVEAFEVWEDDD